MDAFQAGLRRRLARVEGQVKGVRRMLEEDRYCVDILTQVNAARGALLQVSQMVLRNYLESRALQAMHEGDPRVLDELINVINRFNRDMKK